MPDPAVVSEDRGVTRKAPWWHGLGALLPAKIRERVFEPACYERLHRHLDGERGGAVPLPLYPLLVFVDTAGRNFPGVFFDGRSLSRLGKCAAAIVLLVALAALTVNLVRYSYPG